ncbi:SemiSWEET family sugar transporter [Kordiimonas sp.]|uniref:SemiSWEET family sugar transporter n=1 Tax=Kordiimonas sp. TaxID=1970157 RepID=UPI003A8D7B1E
MTFITLLGLLAGSLTTIAFVPQVVRAWKTKSTKDVSLSMFAILCAGIFMWIVYGIAIGDVPVIIANVVTLCLASSVIVAKLRFG